jgi:hypothetical protein
MSCPSDNLLLELKAGHLNALPLVLDDGTTAIDLTGATIRLTARESAEDDPLIEEEVTAHTDAAAGESTIEIDLTAVSDEIKDGGLRLNAEILVLDSLDVLVFDKLFTIQILPSLEA